MMKAVLVGYGGIAQASHVLAYRNLEAQGRIRLTAAYDIDPERFQGKMSINIGSAKEGADESIKFYTDLETMLAEQKPDLVDICLPTPFHANMAIDMLSRGYHVMCEKPMARTYEQAKRMAEAAKKSKGKLMIGQCVRFFPDSQYLKKVIDSGEFGKPLSAVFRRLSGPPTWGWDNWYMDHTRSGGCAFDMHIHDVDIIRYLFGEPRFVSCITQDVYSGDDIVHSRFDFDGLSVLAIGDWSAKGIDFSADFQVAFEKATITSKNCSVTVYPREGDSFSPELSNVDGVTGELSYFLDTIATGAENTQNPPSSAAQTVHLVEMLLESAKDSGKIVLCK